MTVVLREIALEHPELAELDPAARRLALRSLLADRVIPDELGSSVRRLSDEIDGFGPLAYLFDQADVTDILVNGPAEVWVERDGVLQREDITFEGANDLCRLIDRLLSSAGERVDAGKPIADARLSDGSRLHVAVPPIAPSGPLVSIRRFPRRAWSIGDLVDRGMLSSDDADRLNLHVLERRSILVAGGTGTGKTTLLNALLGSIPSAERIVLIEETPELRPVCEHAVSLLARDPNEEGTGEITLADLLRAALRMRPDRIVVGEVRGAEAAVALSAMSTGHPGSLLTIHASSAGGALTRLAALAHEGTASSEETLQHSIDSAIDVVVHLERAAGRRRVVEILER